MQLAVNVCGACRHRHRCCRNKTHRALAEQLAVGLQEHSAQVQLLSIFVMHADTITDVAATR